MLLAVSAVLGLVFGSFATHATTASSMSLRARSSCHFCHKKLPAVALIPVLSFLLQGGKSRCCKKSLPIHYLLWEVGSAAMFFVFVLLFGFFAGCIYGVLILFLAIQTTTDLQSRTASNDLSIATAILLGGLRLVQTHNWQGLLIGIGIPFILFGGQHLLSNGKWIGSADIFVGIAIGAVLFHQSLYVIVLSYMIGAVFAALSLFSKKEVHAVPFIPFLTLSALIILFIGTRIDSYLLAI